MNSEQRKAARQAKSLELLARSVNPRIQRIEVLIELSETDEAYSPVRADGYPELENFFTDINYKVKSIKTEVL